MNDKQAGECIFCRIAAGEAPAFKIYEDELHLGFLDIYPSAKAFGVVIPKAHYPSDFSAAPVEALDGLIRASRGLAVKITAAYEGVERCEFIIEGMDVNHLHARLVPIRKAASDSGSPPGKSGEYSETYPSCVRAEATGEMADPEYLAGVAAWINRVNAL